MEMGTKIRTLRLVREFTQAELAQIAGVEPSVLSRIESGQILPGPELEARLKAALDWPERADEAFAILLGTNHDAAETAAAE